MFDNAYTVAGGVPQGDHDPRIGTFRNPAKVPPLEDSQSSYHHNSYSYNLDKKYEDATNISSIGFMSRFNSNKGLHEEQRNQNRIDLHNIVNKLDAKNPLYSSEIVNIMDFKDNQIFKKRKEYDTNIRLNYEENFDKHDRKFLRRCQSFEDFREVDDTFAPDRRELIEEKCISYPPSPREMEKIEHYLFTSDRLDELGDKMKAEFAFNNLYADVGESKEFDPEEEFGKIRAKRVQTYGQDFHRFKKQGEEEKDEDVELDPEMAQSILDNVIDNLSEDDDEYNNQIVRRTKRDRMALAKKRKMEIPDFAIEDIMGDFDIDDQGNYIIVRNDKTGDLEDKHEKRVNRRGYLVDEDGNIIDKYGNLIFKNRELDSDDEIPPPYSFEKRKMQLLNAKPDTIEDYNLEDIPPEDDEHIWIDPKGKELAETLSGEETPVESLMGETPGRYMPDRMSKKSKKDTGYARSIHEDNMNLDLESQKETIKLESTVHPMSMKSSNRTKRLTSARVKGLGKGERLGPSRDGFVKDVPFYMNQAPLYPDSKRNTPKGQRRRLKKKGPYNDSLKKIYGNIDPFLYKDDSMAPGVRLDKVQQFKEKKAHNVLRLAESAEIEGRFAMANTDEEIDSDLYRNSRLDRVPSKYKGLSNFGDTGTKTKLEDLKGIYSQKSKMGDTDNFGRRTQYNSRMRMYPQNNTITRNMLIDEVNSFGSSNMKKTKKTKKKMKNSRPSVDNVLKPRGIEEGGWV